MNIQPEMTKKDRVLQFIRSRGRVRTSEVIGLSRFIFHNRCLRDAQEFCQRGVIYRMRDELKRVIYGPINEDVFTVYREDADFNLIQGGAKCGC